MIPKSLRVVSKPLWRVAVGSVLSEQLSVGTASVAHSSHDSEVDPAVVVQTLSATSQFKGDCLEDIWVHRLAIVELTALTHFNSPEAMALAVERCSQLGMMLYLVRFRHAHGREWCFVACLPQSCSTDVHVQDRAQLLVLAVFPQQDWAVAESVRFDLAVPYRQSGFTFVIAGFGKCGTSLLVHSLRQHPMISSTPSRLEAHPFELGCISHGQLRDLRSTLLPAGAWRPISGFRVSFLLENAALMQIVARMRLKVIVCVRRLRDWFESQFYHMADNEAERKEMFKLSDGERDQLAEFGWKRVQLLERASELISAERLMVVDLDSLRAHPQMVFSAIFRFLGVAPYDIGFQPHYVNVWKAADELHLLSGYSQGAQTASARIQELARAHSWGAPTSSERAELSRVQVGINLTTLLTLKWARCPPLSRHDELKQCFPGANEYHDWSYCHRCSFPEKWAPSSLYSRCCGLVLRAEFPRWVLQFLPAGFVQGHPAPTEPSRVSQDMP